MFLILAETLPGENEGINLDLRTLKNVLSCLIAGVCTYTYFN